MTKEEGKVPFLENKRTPFVGSKTNRYIFNLDIEKEAYIYTYTIVILKRLILLVFDIFYQANFIRSVRYSFDLSRLI